MKNNGLLWGGQLQFFVKFEENLDFRVGNVSLIRKCSDLSRPEIDTFPKNKITKKKGKKCI